jgi:hypothetical protein
MTKELSRKLTVYSFVLSICIMMRHMTLYEGMLCQPSSAWDAAFYRNFCTAVDALCDLALSYYFLASAFLLYRDADGQNIGRKLKTRLYTLVLPFLLWNTGYAAYLVLVDRENIFTWKTLLRGYTIEPFDVPLWFIVALLLFLVPAPLLARVKGRLPACAIFLAALCLAQYFPTDLLPPDCRSWFVRWFSYWPVYFFGFLLARLCPSAVTRGAYYRRWLSLLAAGYLVCHVFSLPWLRQLRALYAGLWPVQAVAGLVPAVALWLLADSRVFQKPLPYPVTLSFWVYAGHMAGSRLAGLVMRPLLLNVLGDVVWCGWQAVLWRCWFGVQAYLLVLLGSLLASRILPPKLYALFSGGRVASPQTQKNTL